MCKALQHTTEPTTNDLPLWKARAGRCFSTVGFPRVGRPSHLAPFLLQPGLGFPDQGPGQNKGTPVLPQCWWGKGRRHHTYRWNLLVCFTLTENHLSCTAARGIWPKVPWLQFTYKWSETPFLHRYLLKDIRRCSYTGSSSQGRASKLPQGSASITEILRRLALSYHHGLPKEAFLGRAP